MIETPRLILRPARLEDAENLFILNCDPEVMRYTGDSAFANTFESRKLIEERLIPQFSEKKMSRFMVFLKDETFIGWCGLKYFQETQEVDLGYRFMKKFWGQGFATESSKGCLDYGFKTLELPRIIAKTMPANTSSIKVIQKLGMTFRGHLHDPTDPQPFILYDMTKDQYNKCAV